jgi:hypothetical protein
MNEIGNEQLQGTARIAERLGNANPRERGLRSRRHSSVLSGPNSEPADHAETTPHQLDRLA